MKADEVREGDIVEIDYISEFTKEHINEGKALVIWKGFNHQPLVRKLNTRVTIWTSYERIARVIGHTDIEKYMDKTLEQEPKTGHWEFVGDNCYRCTKCGEVYTTNQFNAINNYCDNRFPKGCPNCGAKMESEGRE